MRQELEWAMGEEQDLAQQELAHKAAFPAQVDRRASQVERHPWLSAGLAPDIHHAADLWKNH